MNAVPTIAPRASRPKKFLIGAPDMNKIPPKIINTKRAVPRSLSNKINNSIATSPGAIRKIRFLLPGT